MAKKKGTSQCKQPKPKSSAAPLTGLSFGEMAPDSIEGVLQQLTAKQLGSAMDIGPANTPAAQAQDLVYQAWEARTVAQQMKLIKQALQLDPDCVDALVLLGDRAPSPQAAIDQYRVAIATGERVLANNFADMVGNMWMFLEARGYLRARQSLADALTVTGHLAEAVEEYREILRLNKNDNQGVRERLLALYFELGRNDDALRLLRTYPEDSAAFTYGEVLLSFRIHGDSPETDRLLKAARKVNKHVPTYLLHDKPLPSRIPETYGFGDVNEAVIYAATYLPAWKSSPGAITWLRGAVAPAKKSKSKKTTLTIKVPEATPEQLLAIEQDPTTIWQLDLRQVPTWVENEAGQPVRPWLIMVVREFDAVVVGQEMSLDRPDEDALWRCLTKAILKPFIQEQPARPGIVQVCRHGLHTQFLPKLAALGIACEIHDDLRALDHMLQVLAEATSSGDDRPSLLDIPGIELADLETYYDAAAGYYRHMPWRKIPAYTVLEVKMPDVANKSLYAIVMGQSGIELGLALYEDEKLLQQLLRGEFLSQKSARSIPATSVMFAEAFHLSARDVDAIERHGWNLAGPEAYPFAVVIRGNAEFNLPTVAELRVLTLALLAIPSYLANHQSTLDVPLGDVTRRVMIRQLD